MRRLLIVAVVLAGACSKREETPQGTLSGTSFTVTVASARIETLRETITGTGTIAPAAASDWTIYATESARIAELPKNEGDPVAVGDVLVQFDIPSITQDVNLRQMALSDATARASSAQAAHAKAVDMLDKGVIPRAKLDEAIQDLASANSALAQARTMLAIANDAIERTRVKARFAGTVAKRWHITGDFVSPGMTDPIIRVVDAANVDVTMPLSPAQLERVAPGQAVAITIPGSDAPEAGVVAIRTVAPDPRAPTSELRISFVKPKSVPVDTQVQVEILLSEHPNIIVVPTSSVVLDGTPHVMIAGADGLAHRRDVRPGFAARGLTELIVGVTPGDLVIVKGLDMVTDGAPITIEK